MEANGFTAGTGYDQLVANDSVSIGLSSLFQMTLGYVPAPGDSLSFISLASGSISGFFANLPDGGSYTANYMGTDYTFTTSYAGGDGNNLTLTAVPEPGIAGILGLATGALAFRRRRGTARA